MGFSSFNGQNPIFLSEFVASFFSFPLSRTAVFQIIMVMTLFPFPTRDGETQRYSLSRKGPLLPVCR